MARKSDAKQDYSISDVVGGIMDAPKQALTYPIRALVGSAEKAGQLAGTGYETLNTPILRDEFVGKTKARAKDIGKALVRKGVSAGSDVMRDLGIVESSPEALSTIDPSNAGSFQDQSQIPNRDLILNQQAKLQQSLINQRENFTKDIETALGDTRGAIAAQDRIVKNIETQQSLVAKASDSANRLREQQLGIEALREHDRREDLERTRNAAEQSIDKMEQLGMDRKDFWTDAAMPTKILAGIGLALTSTLKNPMPFMLMNNLVNREAERQEALYRTAKDVSGQRGLLFDRHLREMGDERIASQTFRAQIWDHAAKKVDQQMLQITSEQAKNQAMAVRGQYMQQRDNHINNMIALKNTMNVAGVGSQYDPSTPMHMLPQKIQERWIEGIGPVATKTEAIKIRELKGEMDAAEAGIDRLLNLSKTGSKFSFTDVAKAGIDQKALIGQLRLALTGPGALSEKEIGLLNDIIANPLNLFTPRFISEAKLKTLKEIVNKKVSLAAKSAGAAVKMPTATSAESIGFKKE